MRKTDLHSTRILVDLQACQTAGSANRGVGRYSKSLFLELAASAAPREVYGLAGEQLPFKIDWPLLPEQNVLRPPPLPEWGVARDFDSGERDALDAALMASIVATARPDIVHISHLFEGYGDRCPIVNPKSRPVGQVFSATLYDLIPIRFADHYFSDPRFKAWYMHRVQLLRQADLLLSISEASRQDAINLLGLDPERIVTIHGGIASHFRPLVDSDAIRPDLMARYGINRPKFILYTGGDDHRKNLQGAIEAYAMLPLDTRSQSQLVIVCALEAHRKAFLEAATRKLGLAATDVIFIGFVPENDLVALYGTCDLFVFPSLYEGLGLPVIEAMACGAPVIGGDNTSIREIIAHPDARFDSSRTSEIAASIQRVLTTPELAADLRRYGLERAPQFNWKSSAALAIAAFDEALACKRAAGQQAVVAGWMPRRRIAVLTPLPPDRSGIADYNAAFLPFLAEHFEIDLYVATPKVEGAALNAAFRIFDVACFADNAASYDAILYEFGNSEFHAHMLPLLARFPGIVGLHDAYLSGLFGYLQFQLGETSRFEAEMLRSHAGAARRLLAPVAAHPDAYGAMMVDLPCTKAVLNQATGIISHSAFNLQVARDFYPEGWPAPYRIIPQMVAGVEPWDTARRSAARAELGFDDDDFIIATFGHVAWTKCGDRLLDAFLNSVLAQDRTCRLLFVGELAKDDFGLALNDRIKASGLGDRVKITGFLPDEDYARYLRAVDVMVQLRTKSRGGTPKGVLDGLAFGVPVLVNNEASYEDYPDNVVVKLSPDPDAAEISASLTRLRQAPDERREQGARGLAYVRTLHDPRACAAQYAAFIHECIDRDRASRAVTAVGDLVPHLAGCPDPSSAAALAGDFIAARPAPTFERPRLVIDASHIVKSDHGTGIPRVMRETVRAGYLDPRPGFEVVAVQRDGAELVQASDWLVSQGLLQPWEADPGLREPVTLRPGDHLLMLDSSWAEYDSFAPVFATARAAHVPITTAVYDLLPLRLPVGDTVAGGKDWFEAWVRSAIAASDNLVCISRGAADDLIAYIEAENIGRKGLRVGWWHLGSSFQQTGDAPSGSVVRKITGPYALMVGTIEPRKNHALALDAFEKLWADGSDLALVIAGRPGWLVDDLLARLRTHPQRDRKLFFCEGMSDAEIAHLYRGAQVVLFLSKGEGFGLPLVEAAHYGIPLICSDIPVFREVARDFATYTAIATAEEVAASITRWRADAASGKTRPSSGMPRLTWDESAAALFDVIQNNNWYWEKA